MQIGNLGNITTNPRGAWDLSTEYKRLDVVSYLGNMYIAKKDSQGVTPDTEASEEYWMQAVKNIDVENAGFVTTDKIVEVNLALADLQTNQQETSASIVDLQTDRLSRITNCITEIPQDINLELSDGTLTLKAGSKVYVPNGFESDGTTPKFDVETISSDISLSSWGTLTGKILVSYDKSNGEYAWGIPDTAWYSGDTAPDVAYTIANWYDTANNVIKSTFDSGATWSARGISFPFAECTRTSGVLTSLNCTFNGFGYIGNTVFCLPNVKGLIPNGRNADGTLNNIAVETKSVMVANQPDTESQECTIILGDGTFGQTTNYGYDEILNVSLNAGAQILTVSCGTFTRTNSVVSNFVPKLPFRAIDYSDKAEVAGWGMPSENYIDLTLGASGAAYTAPANGYYVLNKTSVSSNKYIYIENGSTSIASSQRSPSTNTILNVWFPVSKGDTVTVGYTADGETTIFRFIYAEGAK